MNIIRSIFGSSPASLAAPKAAEAPAKKEERKDELKSKTVEDKAAELKLFNEKVKEIVESKPFYHGKLSREGAEGLLKGRQFKSYLLRDSSLGGYAVSYVLKDGTVDHIALEPMYRSLKDDEINFGIHGRPHENDIHNVPKRSIESSLYNYFKDYLGADICNIDHLHPVNHIKV